MIIRSLPLFTAAFWLTVTPATAADQFDLICKGREKTSTFGKWSPAESRYRVDLVSKTWCRGDCSKTDAIQSIDPSRITFTNTVEPDSGAGTTLHWIDRTTGKWTDVRYSSLVAFRTEGICEAAPFSGFPAQKF